MNKSENAKKLFEQGYNCAQSVLCAFCEETGIGFNEALKLSSSFGGGMGRLREVCGAVSAMFMVAGIKYGYADPSDNKAKSEHYKLVQELAKNFSGKHGSIICKELLGLGKQKSDHVPTDRTKEFYQKRPCVELVSYAAEIVENLIESKEKGSRI